MPTTSVQDGSGVCCGVTLPEDGAPLVNETIPPCGCDHRFIPTDRVRPQPESTGQVALVSDRLIAGSERAKWVYFSPMGVASARQMLVNRPLGQLR
jgi:hypothetical protein